MRTIYEFKKGDEIVRIKPAKSLGLMSVGFFGENVIDRGGDRSYMGQKLIFVGIANGQIYCQRTDTFSLNVFGDKLLGLSLDIWDEGWDFYVDPTTLLNGLEIKMDVSTIEEQIKKAIENEDYELAEKLKSKLP
jgi:hypothetical protein